MKMMFFFKDILTRAFSVLWHGYCKKRPAWGAVIINPYLVAFDVRHKHFSCNSGAVKFKKLPILSLSSTLMMAANTSSNFFTNTIPLQIFAYPAEMLFWLFYTCTINRFCFALTLRYSPLYLIFMPVTRYDIVKQPME